MILRKKLACNYQGRPEIFWRPGQVNNLAPLPTDVLLSSRDWAGEPLQCHVPKLCIFFEEITTHVQTWVHRHHMSGYSSAVLASLRGWLPGQLPGWPDLTNSTCCTHLMLLGLIPSNIWWNTEIINLVLLSLVAVYHQALNTYRLACTRN